MLAKAQLFVSLSPTVQLVFQASLPKLAPLPADSPAATPESGQAIAAEFEPAKRFMISTNWVRYVAGGPERPGGAVIYLSVALLVQNTRLRKLAMRYFKALRHETLGRAFRKPVALTRDVYLDAQRNPATVTIMTSTVTSKTSIEPSPSSGEKPKCRSIKSRGAAFVPCTQSSTAPQTPMIEPKLISAPRSVGSILISNKAEIHSDHPPCWARRLCDNWP